MNKGKKIKKALFVSLTVLCIAALIVSVCLALGVYLPQRNSQKSFENIKMEFKKSPDTVSAYNVLKAKNSDYAGWLSIEGTQIDYPVMKPPKDDAEYYLHRDFYKNDSAQGSLFLGEGCDVNSLSFIVYGHNMQTETMFGTLDNYKSYSFAKEHSEIIFTDESGDKVYRVFSAFQTQLDDANFKYYEEVGDLSEIRYNEAVEALRALSEISLNTAPEYPARIMLLSTCSYHTQNGRFVVAAYEIT